MIVKEYIRISCDTSDFEEGEVRSVHFRKSGDIDYLQYVWDKNLPKNTPLNSSDLGLDKNKDWYVWYPDKKWERLTQPKKYRKIFSCHDMMEFANRMRQLTPGEFSAQTFNLHLNDYIIEKQQKR